ncbi:hypothetical protein DFH07DRAFT_1007248 [Mycena maculata]|uniref:Nephrocystin 3-like N-terminal domain-containing protein n=1 Tax=Mycena maculata TaxID=230809 RepID=A0AAD7HKG3_9AGAR|nr:hypothetical protein DFH07DRAFT_1007248 [Mycena maculata]
MSFNGAQISGGTFYHVAGNMTQISNNLTSVYVPAATIQGPGAQGFLPMAMASDGSDPTEEGDRAELHTDPMQIKHHVDDSSRNARSTQHAGPTDPDIPEGPTAGPVPHHLFQTLQATPGGAFYDPRYTNATVMPNIPNHTFTSILGMNILYRYVAMEALHDSGERFPEPACHPGTRTQILEDLRAWSIDTTPESTLLWLYGSAGVGKSAIAQMFAGDCQSRNRLGASFFFRRGHPRRGTWNNLFPTIAYQLAHSVSELFLPIQQAVENDKLVVGRAMEVQFQKLIIEPLRNAPAPKFPSIIVLDGLDECEDYTTQQQILHLFIGALQFNLPVRILISSRPESHLREVLETQDTYGLCRQYKISTDSAAIRIYLQDEFKRIQLQYAARGIDLGAVWPPAEALDHLVTKSSGIFIYAATVIRFVDDQYSHPTDQLQSVLSLDPQSTAPLDDLYTKILSALPQEQKELRILHTLWRTTMGMDGLQWMDPEEIDMLLDLHRGTCRISLRALESLFSVPPIRRRLASLKSIEFLHASFADYLCDARRSGQWCVSIPWLQSDYLHSIIRMLSTPPVTFHARNFCRATVRVLPHLLKDERASESLIHMMRDQTFQHSLFISVINVDSARWPKEDTQYPTDLIQLWGDHSFINEFISNLRNPRHLSDQPLTFQFDWIYQEIFTRHPDVLLVLRTLMLDPTSSYLWHILRLYWMTYRIFEPFARFQRFLQFPFPEGDSPLDFLMDPVRAGVLYRNPEDIAEDYMLLWIHRAKEVLEGQNDFWLDG